MKRNDDKKEKEYKEAGVGESEAGAVEIDREKRK